MKFAVGKGKLEVRLKNAEQEEKAQNVLSINPQFQFMNISNAEMNRMIKAMSVKITQILNRIKFDSF